MGHQGNEMYSKLGQVNKLIEPYGSQSGELFLAGNRRG